MIKWLFDEFLLNIPYDCMNFISYASYRNTLRKKVKFWPKIKIPLALDIKNWGFQHKKARGGSRDKKKQKIGALTIDRWSLTKRSIGSWTGRPVRRGWGFKEAPALHFLHYSPPFLKTLHIPASKDQFGQDLEPFAGLGVDFGTFLMLGFRSET